MKYTAWFFKSFLPKTKIKALDLIYSLQYKEDREKNSYYTPEGDNLTMPEYKTFYRTTGLLEFISGGNEEFL